MQASIRSERAIKDKKTTIPANRQGRQLPHASVPKRGSVLPGRNAEAARERTTESFRRGKAAGCRDFFKSQCRRFNLTTCSFEAKILDVSCRRLAHLFHRRHDGIDEGGDMPPPVSDPTDVLKLLRFKTADDEFANDTAELTPSGPLLDPLDATPTFKVPPLILVEPV